MLQKKLKKFLKMNPEKLKYNKIIELMPKGKLKILDAGCGEGGVSNLLNKRGYVVRGFDKEKGDISKAIRKYNGIPFEVKDALNVDYSGYDAIIAWGLFEYVLEIDRLLNKIKKEMKKDSVLLFSVPNVCSLSKRFKCLMGVNPNRERIPHLTFTFLEAINLLRKHGFQIKKVTSLGYDGVKGFYFPTPKNLSSEIVIKVTK